MYACESDKARERERARARERERESVCVRAVSPVIFGSFLWARCVKERERECVCMLER